MASYMELLTEGSKKTLRIIQISLAEQALDRLELGQYYILGHVYCYILGGTIQVFYFSKPKNS